MKPEFVLSKEKLIEQYKKLKDSGLKISYSYKTNKEVGNLLQELDETSDTDFSIHDKREIDMISENKRKDVWFFVQAESVEELEEIMDKGIEKFVIDNEVDLDRVLGAVNKQEKEIDLSLRMKFREHRIGSGKYYVYGMDSKKVNNIILNLENCFLKSIGIHIHRKTQNTSEWDIKEELEDSLSEEVREKISFVNLGGGLPVRYRSSNMKILEYIFDKIEEVRKWLEEKNIECYIEPGRFIAAPCIKLETEIVQIQGRTIVINTSIYRCALDTILTNTKMLVEGEIFDDSNQKNVKDYLIKGNSPTRDDIFRYNVKLKEKKTGDKIVFINAGAYNYTTDFFGYEKLDTRVVEKF